MRIQIIGDSNTYGYSAGGGRLSQRERWPELLRGLRPEDDVRIDGSNGRSLLGTGEALIEEALLRGPELLIVQLGTNDLLMGLGVSIVEEWLLRRLPRWTAMSQVLWVLPGAIDTVDEALAFGPPWMANASRALAKRLSALELPGFAVVETADLAIDRFDGLHLAPAGHRALAERVAQTIAQGEEALA